VSPVLGHISPEQQLIEGEQMRLPCIVIVGTPKPVLVWTKNGLPVQAGDGSIEVRGQEGAVTNCGLISRLRAMASD
jgi:hypothetical protein